MRYVISGKAKKARNWSGYAHTKKPSSPHSHDRIYFQGVSAFLGTSSTRKHSKYTWYTTRRIQVVHSPMNPAGKFTSVRTFPSTCQPRQHNRARTWIGKRVVVSTPSRHSVKICSAILPTMDSPFLENGQFHLTVFVMYATPSTHWATTSTYPNTSTHMG